MCNITYDCLGARFLSYKMEINETIVSKSYKKIDIVANRERLVLDIVLFLLLVLVIIIGFVYYKRYQDKKWDAMDLDKVNREILGQYQQVKRLNIQNELLLKEIHHRIKNNLQLASSLLNMKIRTSENQEAITALQESASRLQSMLLVHHELYSQDTLGEVDMQNYTKRLLQNLLASYNSLTRQVISEIVIDQIRLKSDAAIPLGLMLTELITNSVKYAKPEKADALKIGIRIDSMEEGEYVLRYSDNGQGLPSAIDLYTANSMGLRLMRNLVKQMNGTLEYAYLQGAVFIINFKST